MINEDDDVIDYITSNPAKKIGNCFVNALIVSALILPIFAIPVWICWVVFSG